MTAAECKSDFKLTTDTPYLALTGVLWGVYYENFEEKRPRYNGTALQFAMFQATLMPNAWGGELKCELFAIICEQIRSDVQKLFNFHLTAWSGPVSYLWLSKI